MFAVGENGLGKRTLVTRLLAERAKHMPTPNDWVYVHHFEDIRRPIAIDFPAGMAIIFQQKSINFGKMPKKLVAKLLGDTHQNHIELIKSAIPLQQNKRFDAINADAKQHNLVLKTTGDGRVHFVAIDDSKPIDTKSSPSFKTAFRGTN